MVQRSAEVSRLIVTGSTYLSNKLTSGADNFAQNTEPNPKQIHFSDTTQQRIRQASNLSRNAAQFTARATGTVSGAAQNIGATVAGAGRHSKDDSSYSTNKGAGGGSGGSAGKVDKRGNPIGPKPGILNKSLIAFTTLTDGLETGAKNVLNSGSSAATTVVSHKYGNDAGSVARDFTSGFKNVGLVYIDATGVSRKAFIKSVAKGMVVGRTKDGKRVMVGSGDGGDVPPEVLRSSGRTPPPPYDDAAGTSSLSGPPSSHGEKGLK